MARVLLITKPDRDRVDRSDPAVETSNPTFDGGRHVSSEEIIDQPTVRCKERHSGHNRSFEFETVRQVGRETGTVAQSGDSPVAPHGHQAVDTGGQEGGGQSRWLAGCSRPMNRKAGRGNLWPRLSAPE